MFNQANERKATPKELTEAQQVYAQLTQAGLEALYAGGRRSKGQGFWVNGLGYKSCQECLALIANPPKEAAFIHHAYTLMGYITDETEAGYTISVTSCDRKAAEDLIGSRFFVGKSNVTIF